MKIKELTETIILIVCLECDLAPCAIFSNSKTREASEVRFIIYIMLRQYTGLTLDQVASLMGKSSHCTISNGIQKLKQLLSIHDPIRHKVALAEKKIISFINSRSIVPESVEFPQFI